MWEIILKLIPPPLLLGLLIYGAIVLFWLQPVAEERMAVPYIAQCEAGNLPKIRVPKPMPKKEPETGEAEIAPMVELPLSVQVIREFKSLLGDEEKVALPYEEGGSDCACAVSRAFDQVFWPSFFHVASVRTYTPRAIQHFDQYVARETASGICTAQR